MVKLAHWGTTYLIRLSIAAVALPGSLFKQYGVIDSNKGEHLRPGNWQSICGLGSQVTVNITDQVSRARICYGG
jgi:hypothetical protein